MDACMAKRGGVGGRTEADGEAAGEDVETTTLGLKVETASEDGEEMELVMEVKKDVSCDDVAVKHELHEETPGSDELTNVDGCRVCDHVTEMRRRKFDEMVIEYDNLLDMGIARRMNKEDITIDKLRWRIKEVRTHGPTARGLWTPAHGG